MAAILIALVVSAAVAAIMLLPNSACSNLSVPPAAGPIEEKRTLPSRFPRNTHLPEVREVFASGAIDTNSFNAARDLVRFNRLSVWFESDYDKEDGEDDHLVHRSLLPKLEKLVSLVESNRGRLKVHEGYRCKGVHKTRSLHREGRAVDLTCEGLTLSELAKLCWVAGFDWVYYEAPKGGGDHVHCSVRR